MAYGGARLHPPSVRRPILAMLTTLLVTLTQAVAPLAVAGLSWLATQAALWLKDKTKNENVKAIINRIQDAVTTAVKQLEQTVVREIKAATEPTSEGGTLLTKEEMERIKAKCIELVRRLLGEETLRLARQYLGLDDKGLDSLISGKIEATVLDLKKEPYVLPPFRMGPPTPQPANPLGSGKLDIKR